MSRDTDSLSPSGAYKLADTIRDYWAARGVRAKVWVEQCASKVGPLWCVRSDLASQRVA